MLRQKAARLRELLALLRAAADAPSRRAIFGCYRVLGRSLRDPREITVRMRGRAGPVTCHLRRSDILTLGEVFGRRVYAAALPLPSGAFVLDAGANIGLTAAWIKAYHPDATVLAFEPDPENAALARANFASLPGCEVVEMALADQRGQMQLHQGLHAATHSLLDDQGEGSLPVTATTVAAVMASRSEDRIDLLKLDVEGAELRVLAGMGPWLARTTCIVGELHETFASAGELCTVLGDAGLRTRLFALGEDAVRGFVAVRSLRAEHA